MSDAFYPVDHYVLFTIFKDMFGLSGIWCDWFRSYLESACSVLLSDVPKGSSLGPLVIAMHTRPLGLIGQR